VLLLLSLLEMKTCSCLKLWADAPRDRCNTVWPYVCRRV